MEEPSVGRFVQSTMLFRLDLSRLRKKIWFMNGEIQRMAFHEPQYLRLGIMNVISNIVRWRM